jgi:polar amino acid transport system substrate-binding protein
VRLFLTIPNLIKRRTSLFALAALLAFGATTVAAQTPNFWDPNHRTEKPDLSGIQLLRFVTEDDYPPFDFLAPDGSLTGFNVDFARAICDALSVSCTIQARRWDTIVNSLAEGKADAAAASLADSPDNRKALDFTIPYYRTPARFVVRKQSAIRDAIPEGLVGQTIGVQAHTAHEAYLRAFFPRSNVRVYETEASLLSALKRNEVEIVFGDGISLASWLNGTDSEDCCMFKGGPFTESRYFGYGVGLAVRKGNSTLRQALDWAIAQVGESGVYSELYLKYFPIGFY